MSAQRLSVMTRSIVTPWWPNQADARARKATALVLRCVPTIGSSGCGQARAAVVSS
jgi:hypothetical protein